MSNILDIFKDPRKVEIGNQLKALGIKIFTIDHQYLVTINQSVIIYHKKLKKCPVNIHRVNGNFIWHYSELETMENLPLLVYGNFSVAYNKLTTLEGAKTVLVTGIFNCSGNKLKNLRGSPSSCGSFVANLCQLESLEGSPVKIKNDFWVTTNNLKTLEGGPKNVPGTYDCSNNNLESLYGISKNSKKVISFSNPFQEKKGDIEYKKIDVPLVTDYDHTQNFKQGDKIIYNKPDSKFNKFIGTINLFTLPTEEIPYVTYDIIFKKSDNNIEKDAMVNNVRDKYLTKHVEEFQLDDYIEFINPKSKYNGRKGRIFAKEPIDGEFLYKARFEYDYNPGLVDIVPASNKNAIFINIIKIKGDELRKISLEEVLKSKIDKPIKNKDEFEINDKIIYNNKNYSFYNNCKGVVISKSKYTYSNSYSYGIRLTDKDGKITSMYSVDKENLSIDDSKPINYVEEKEQEFSPKKKFKVGDEIIYVAKKSDSKNKEYHLHRGDITYVNNFVGNNDTCDIILPVQKKIKTLVRLYNIPNENLFINDDEFKTGDKVVYDNLDDDFNGKIGIVTQKNNKIYNVTFNDGDETLTITNVPSRDLTKFLKPIGTEVRIDDDIVYTKSDSKHYGCNGTVTNYSPDEDKPYEIEIQSKDNRTVRIKTKDENLEKLPPKKLYKKGDKIKYVNSNSPYDGFIGTVAEVIGKGKNTKYEITIKNLKEDNIYLECKGEDLILLEEAPEEKSDKLIIGNNVKYVNTDSKHNGKIGEYQGERIKDGVKQLIVKFDDGPRWLTVYVDDGTLIPSNFPITKTTYVSPTTTTTTTTKKKKKKEPEPEKDPVMVFNRRNVARKTYKKPDKLISNEEEI